MGAVGCILSRRAHTCRLQAASDITCEACDALQQLAAQRWFCGATLLRTRAKPQASFVPAASVHLKSCSIARSIWYMTDFHKMQDKGCSCSSQLQQRAAQKLHCAGCSTAAQASRFCWAQPRPKQRLQQQLASQTMHPAKRGPDLAGPCSKAAASGSRMPHKHHMNPNISPNKAHPAHEQHYG